MKKALDYSVLPFSLLTVLFLSACNNDEDDMDPSKPSIEVTVVNSNNEAVENATVTLLNFDDPLSSKIKFTDEEGLAVFPDLDTARYVMTAEKSGVGTANASVTVEEAMVYSETLELNAVTLNTQAPTIFTVNDEYLPNSMMPIDTVEINLEFMDNDTPVLDLVVTATCDIDGELFAGNPNDEERVHIQHIPGTKGVHEITVTATDKNGNQSTTVFTANAVDVVPTEVSTTKQYKKVLVEWADNVEQDFQKLEVQRMNYATDEYEVLATFTDESVTSFVDDDIPYWGNSLHRIVTYDSENRKGESKVANTPYPAGVFFNYSGDTEIKSIQLHPDRDWVYIITNDNSNNKIFIYDYQQDIIVKELSLDYLPGYAVLADNGSGLQMFVPSADGGIYIYSSDEQMDLLQTIETGEPCTSVAMNGNIIVAGMDLGYNEDYAARTYSQSTGNMIDSTGLYTEIRVFGVPNKPNVFMGIDYTTSIWELLYFEIDNNGFFTMDVKDDKGFDYDIDFRITSVSKTGDYIICEDDIFETNSGMAHITSFPTTSMKSATTNADGSMIYAFDFYESKQISSYSYPSLTQQTSYPTLESPVFVKVKDNKAIVLSGTYVGIKSIIEVIDL